MTTTAPIDIPALRAAVATLGTLPTAALLGTNRESLLRLLAGIPVRAGTLALIRQNIHLLAEATEPSTVA